MPHDFKLERDAKRLRKRRTARLVCSMVDTQTDRQRQPRLRRALMLSPTGDLEVATCSTDAFST
jgi:hypothetical protein